MTASIVRGWAASWMFPTLIIIDQHGKVADIHVGYSPDLLEEVTTTIDRLLDAK